MLVLIFFIVSLFASSIGAVFGIGGGVIIKPILDSLNIMKVTKISFLSSCTVLSMSLYTFINSKLSKTSLVDTKIATPFALGAVLGGLIGKILFSYTIHFFNNQNIAGIIQSSILIILLIFTVMFTIKNMSKNKIKPMHINNIFLSAIIGMVLGLLSSYLGIGGGPFNIAFLYIFFAMDNKTAAENSLYIILFSQISSVLTTLIKNEIQNINIYILIVMIIGGIGGGIIGRKISKKLNSSSFDKIFIIILILIIFISIYNLYVFTSKISI